MGDVSANFNATALQAARYAENKRAMASDATKELASGSRIISAARDASSAAIASQLKSSGSVIAQAKINANNAKSVIQTATSSLNQIKDILSTMDALTAKANSADSDAKAKSLMNAEYTQLRDQITDIASRTRWNGVNLLSGGSPSLSFTTGGAAVTAAGTPTAVTNAYAATAATITGFVDGTVVSVDAVAHTGGYKGTIVLDNNGRRQTFEAVTTPSNAGTVRYVSTHDDQNSITLTYAAAVTAITNAATFQSTLAAALMPNNNPMAFSSASVDPAAAANGITPNGTGVIAASAATRPGEYRISYVANSGKMHISSADYSEEVDVADGAQTVTFNGSGLSLTTAAGFDTTAAFAGVNFVAVASSSNSMTFQVGERSTDTLVASFSPATGAALGISSTTVDTVSNATNASSLIKAALLTVNNQYAALGSQQGRLEQTALNLTVTAENLNAAEHNYVDADIADAIIRQQLGTIGAELANMGVGKSLALNQQLLRMAQAA